MQPSRSPFLPLLHLAAALTAMSCIERTNPFDPANSRGLGSEIVRAAAKPGLDSLSAEADTLRKALDADREAFWRDSSTNANRLVENTRLKAANQDRLTGNAAVEAFNQAHDSQPDSLRFQVFYVLLETLVPYRLDAEFDARRNRLQFLASQAANRLSALNLKHYPDIIYDGARQDSILGPFRRDTAAYGAFRSQIDAANRQLADSNAAIAAYNGERLTDNEAVAAFNEDVAFRKAASNNPVITHPDSLKTQVAAAKPGDTLLVGAGTLPVELRFASGTADSPIVIRGSPGFASVLRPLSAKDYPAIVSAKSFIRFEGLVFRGGLGGIKVEGNNRGISFRRCLFDSNATWGLEVLDSDVEIKDCEMRANGGGIRYATDGSKGYQLTMDNILVARNRGHGLEGLSMAGEITRCTFADNGHALGAGSGIYAISPLQSLTITNSIFSGNRNFGIYRQPTPLNQEGFVVERNDFWENGEGRWSLVDMDSSRVQDISQANLSVDPGFANPGVFDYGLKPDSRLRETPLAIVIGYRRRP